MRRSGYFISLLFFISLVLSSCEDKKFHTFTANVPVYLSFDDLRKSIVIDAPRAIEKPGKIYFKDDFVFINEFMQGVHIIDISDPADPTPVSYIPVPGNIDMAIKDDLLYLDSYVDLLMIDISDPSSPVEMMRLENLLEYTLPPYDNEYPIAEVDEEEGVVTGWEVAEHTQEIHYVPYPWPVFMEYDMVSSSRPLSGGGGAAGSAYGIGGSMARFLTYDNYLYMLQSDNQLKVVDISDTGNPEEKYSKYVGWGLETMFIYDGYMYLGATAGMYILSLEDPDSPFVTAQYAHITSCDPVVVSGNKAYVTLRSGNICGGTADLLEVIDISDKYNPKLLASHSINNPYGLGISGSTLFVCRGDYGLVVYDATNYNTIKSNKLAEFTDILATDVIPVNDVLFTIGDGGFYIYDFSDLLSIHLVGSIPVSPGD